MIYKIIVDKQSSANPSSEKREYTIDIEELRVKGDIYDSLVITKDEDYVMRRLSLSELQVLTVLEEPIKQTIPNLNIELFEGDNYIYLLDMTGNKFYAEYIVKNDFTDTYVTTNMMTSAINQSAKEIELSVNQKLIGYSTTEEMNASINMKANEIKEEVSNTYATQEELVQEKSERVQTATQISEEVSKKVDEETITGAYLILKINGDTSEAKLNADKIELTANDILNLLAGNTINLTSKNIVISGTNFEVDKNGNMTAVSATLTNAKIVSNNDSSKITMKDGQIETTSNNGYKGVVLEGQYLNVYSYNINNNYIGRIGSYTDSELGYQLISIVADEHDGISLGYTKNNKVFDVLRVNYNNSNGLDLYGDININNGIFYNARVSNSLQEVGNIPLGYNGHNYGLAWSGSQLDFWVDATNVGTLSDKRLKTEIQDIDEDFIKAIKEVEMKQFKIANRNGLVSFGILAQDLIEIFKKHNKNPFDYEIVQETQYKKDDDTIYYKINYEQYLILKTKAQEQEIKALREKDIEKDNLIKSLIERIEKLEAK